MYRFTGNNNGILEIEFYHYRFMSISIIVHPMRIFHTRTQGITFTRDRSLRTPRTIVQAVGFIYPSCVSIDTFTCILYDITSCIPDLMTRKCLSRILDIASDCANSLVEVFGWFWTFLKMQKKTNIICCYCFVCMLAWADSKILFHHSRCLGNAYWRKL